MKLSSRYLIREYVTNVGKNPFRDWLNHLDVVIKARIQARIFRFEEGNLGDYKIIGKGVLEARLSFGPGYRIYFGIVKGNVILLLLGGDKTSQKRDIKKAQKYWNNYLESKEL